MDYILGLDLGASSLGWAVLEARQLKTGRLKPIRLVDAGVRIFEAGVEGEIEKGKDSSRAAQRREARQPRRQHWRRQHRKRKLFEQLQSCGLFPPSESSTPEDRKITRATSALSLASTSGNRQSGGGIDSAPSLVK